MGQTAEGPCVSSDSSKRTSGFLLEITLIRGAKRPKRNTQGYWSLASDIRPPDAAAGPRLGGPPASLPRTSLVSACSFHGVLFYFLVNFLYMTALGLCCCKRVFSGCSKRVLFFIVVHRLLTAVASLTAEQASVVAAHGPSSCGLWA